MFRIGFMALVLGVSLPAAAHVSCKDLLEIEGEFGRAHSINVVLISLSSYVTGYVSSMAIFGDSIMATTSEEINPATIEWIVKGIESTRLQTYRDLFFVNGSELNEANLQLAARQVVILCRGEPGNTVINLFESKVIRFLSSGVAP